MSSLGYRHHQTPETSATPVIRDMGDKELLGAYRRALLDPNIYTGSYSPGRDVYHTEMNRRGLSPLSGVVVTHIKNSTDRVLHC